MIQSFNCKDTQALYEGKRPRKFKAFLSVAERKLAQLDAAQTLEFLNSSPGNRLEALIVKERRDVTADTAARLAKYFGGDAASWLVMQANYGLKTLSTLTDIERQVPFRARLAA